MILCCGEALIDLLPRQLPTGETAFVSHAGGAVYNTALALGRLGAKTGFLSGLSHDRFGDLLRAKLHEANVAVIGDADPLHPTPLAVVHLDQGHASYSFYLDATAGQQFHRDTLPATANAQAYFFGGISLVDEPCGTSFERLMQQAARDHLVMIDPNIRPNFIKDQQAARARYTRLLPLADIVKLSVEDLDWLAPDAPQALVTGLLAGRTKIVCVTKGAEGIEIHRRAQPVLARAAPAITVADTVGAGDAFNAGLLHGLQLGGYLSRHALAQMDLASLIKAVDLALAVAQISVSRIGAHPPWAHEIAGVSGDGASA